MRKRSILYSGLILAALLSGLNLLALRFYLYWPKEGIFGFDTFMHFLGGLSLGVLVVWLFNPTARSAGSFLAVFAAVMALGVVWEIFEYVFDITGIASNMYWKDTVHDLAMDALGGVAAYLLATTSRRE